MSCSRPAATMRKRRNTSATASIAARFRSSSAPPSRARPGCRPTATSSRERRPVFPAWSGPVAPARGHPERGPRRHLSRRRHPARAGDIHRELSARAVGHERRRDQRHPRALRIRCRPACPLPLRCPCRRPLRSVQGRGEAQVDDVLPASSRLVIEGNAKLDTERDVQGHHRQPAHTAALLCSWREMPRPVPGPRGREDGTRPKQSPRSSSAKCRRQRRPNSGSSPATASSRSRGPSTSARSSVRSTVLNAAGAEHAV